VSALADRDPRNWQTTPLDNSCEEFAMNQATEIIDLEEFRKRRNSKPSTVRTSPPATLWSPVWVWVMVWPG
jgi:hypothetical protein